MFLGTKSSTDDWRIHKAFDANHTFEIVSKELKSLAINPLKVISNSQESWFLNHSNY